MQEEPLRLLDGRAHLEFFANRFQQIVVHRLLGVIGRHVIQHRLVEGLLAPLSRSRSQASGICDRAIDRGTFQQFISIFENFLFELLRLWLLAYPQSLAGKKVDFKTVWDAPNKDAIALLVVNKELNELLYERPAGWFAYLEGKVKLGCPTASEIDRIAEAKASRNVLIHNRGVASKTYEAKAGALARYKDGQRIDIPEHYHRETWELLRKVITDVANAAIAKVP